MARSTYVYIVRNTAGEIVAAFTVKWELGLWLRCDPHGKYSIVRLRDGVSPGRPVPIDPNDARTTRAT